MVVSPVEVAVTLFFATLGGMTALSRIARGFVTQETWAVTDVVEMRELSPIWREFDVVETSRTRPKATRYALYIRKGPWEGGQPSDITWYRETLEEPLTPSTIGAVVRRTWEYTQAKRDAEAAITTTSPAPPTP